VNVNPYVSLAFSITAILLSIASVVVSMANNRRNRK
jgi:hypothetical protein